MQKNPQLSQILMLFMNANQWFGKVFVFFSTGKVAWIKSWFRSEFYWWIDFGVIETEALFQQCQCFFHCKKFPELYIHTSFMSKLLKKALMNDTIVDTVNAISSVWSSNLVKLLWNEKLTEFNIHSSIHPSYQKDEYRLEYWCYCSYSYAMHS